MSMNYIRNNLDTAEGLDLKSIYQGFIDNDPHSFNLSQIGSSHRVRASFLKHAIATAPVRTAESSDFNSAPMSLQFDLNQSSFNSSETLNLTSAWVYDENGSNDLSRVDFWLQQPDGNWLDISDANSFTAWSDDNRWGSFNYSYSLEELGAGNYTLWAQAVDQSGAISNELVKSFAIANAPTGLHFDLNYSTYNTGESLSLTSAWVDDEDGSNDLSRVDFWLQQPDGSWLDISDTDTFTPWSNDEGRASFNYSYSLEGLAAGTYSLWGQVVDQSGLGSEPVLKSFTLTDTPSTQIRGTHWDDLNGNSVQDTDEPGLAGWTIYLDQNLNGQFDTGEVSTITDASGNYAFINLLPGTYTVAELPQQGWTSTFPNQGMQSTLIPVTNRRDLIFDPQRDLLYITTNDGDLERYDIATRTLLTPFDVGNSLYGGDITPDGSALYVAEGQAGATQGFIRKVNLTDGTVSNLTFNLQYDDLPRDVAISSNGLGFIRSTGQWGPVRQIDLLTDTITPRMDIGSYSYYGGAQITRSANRSLLFFTQDGISSGPISTYDAVTNTFSDELSTNAYLGSNLSAVNRNGSLIALEWGSGISVMDQNLNAVENLNGVDGGLAFDPVSDILYAASTTSDQVIAFDTNTWQELYRLNIGENIPSDSYGNTSIPFGNGMMSVSDDGQFLFMSTPSGVRMLTLGLPGTYSVSLSDGEIVNNINFAANAVPVLSTNQGLALDEGAIASITSSLLQVTDADNTATQLTYTVGVYQPRVP